MKYKWKILTCCLLPFVLGGCFSRSYRSDSYIVNARSYDDIVDEPAIVLEKNSILDLSEAIKIAKKNSPSLKEAWFAINAAKNRKMQSYSTYYPSLSYVGGAGKMTSDVHYSDASIGDNNTSRDSFSNSLEAEFIVFDGFSREMKVLMAQSDSKSKELAYKDAERILTKAVKLQFYKIILAENNYHIATDNLDFQQDVLAIAQKKRTLQLIRIDEVLNFESNVNKAQDAIIQTKIFIQIEREVLARLMGMKSVSFYDSIRLAELKNKNYNLMELNHYLNLALQHRPDLEEQRILIDRSNYNVDLKKAGYYPLVTLNGSYTDSRIGNDSAGSNSPDTTNITSGSGSAIWPLFDGLSTYHKVKEAEELLKIQEMMMEETWLSVASEVRQAYWNLTEAYERLELKKRLVDINTRRRDLIKKSYKIGVVNVTELNEAQQEVNIARSLLNSIKVNIHEFTAQLEASSGTTF